MQEIAPLIGVVDHTTVIYNVKTACDYIETDDWFKNKVEEVEKEIENFSIFTGQ